MTSPFGELPKWCMRSRIGGDVSSVLLLRGPSLKHGMGVLTNCWTDCVYPDAIHRVIQGHRFCQRDQGSLHRDIRLQVRLTDETDHKNILTRRTCSLMSR